MGSKALAENRHRKDVLKSCGTAIAGSAATSRRPPRCSISAARSASDRRCHHWSRRDRSSSRCVGLGRPELPPARAAGAVNPIRRVGVGQESVGELWRQGTVRVGQQGGAVLYRELRENHREIVVSHGSGRYASLATGSGDGLRRRARRASHPAVPDARIRCVPPHSQGLRGRCR